MPRSARALSSTGIYHVVIKGADRQLMFEETKDFEKYLEVLEFYKEQCNFELYAYCLMSNHVHLLIHVGDVPLETIFRRVNTKYAVWFNMKYDRSGYLQKGRYHSEPVENRQQLMNTVRYIHYNPTKAGLEQNPGQTYPWNSYREYLKKEPVLIDTEFILKCFDGKEYFLEFHKAKPTEACMDIDHLGRRMPDDVARNIVCEVSGCENMTEFGKMSLLSRKKNIIACRERGISARQLSRLTGLSESGIRRILEEKRTAGGLDPGFGCGSR